MNFKLLEDEKPEVVFPGDLDVTIIPSPPSPLTSAVDTDLHHEMLTPNWKDSQIIDTIPVQLETDTQAQSSKRRKNKDDDACEKKKKVRKTSKATQTDEKKKENKGNGEKEDQRQTGVYRWGGNFWNYDKGRKAPLADPLRLIVRWVPESFVWKVRGMSRRCIQSTWS